jgi:hypothetical protein
MTRRWLKSTQPCAWTPTFEVNAAAARLYFMQSRYADAIRFNEKRRR